METRQKMIIIYINDKGKIDLTKNSLESCTLDNFARDYNLSLRLNNVEIDETRNGNVYFKNINKINDKIFYVTLYVLKSITIQELKDDIDDIKIEMKFRNEE